MTWKNYFSLNIDIKKKSVLFMSHCSSLKPPEGKPENKLDLRYSQYSTQVEH